MQNAGGTGNWWRRIASHRCRSPCCRGSRETAARCHPTTPPADTRFPPSGRLPIRRASWPSPCCVLSWANRTHIWCYASRNVPTTTQHTITQYASKSPRSTVGTACSRQPRARERTVPPNSRRASTPAARGHSTFIEPRSDVRSLAGDPGCLTQAPTAAILSPAGSSAASCCLRMRATSIVRAGALAPSSASSTEGSMSMMLTQVAPAST
jgi:hypothetical protein